MHPSIFVSIASYRDSQCQYTVQDLFQKAAHPERVVAGICFQVAEDDGDNFLLDLGLWTDRIRTYFIRHTEAKGPCYARALVQQHLFKGEDYYFQIDSHFRFVEGWDEICLEQLGKCASAKPILTAYASSYTLPTDYKPGEPDRAVLAAAKGMTVLCADGFGDLNKDDPFLRIKTRNCRSDFGHIPPAALFWTARFAFSRGDVVHEVPYDPHLEYIFFGEEISMSARLWTAGWDLFNPTKTIAFHLGSRAHRHWFREVQTAQDEVRRETQAKHRICGTLGVAWPDGRPHPMPPAPYGLGAARPLQAYQDFAGVDFARQEVYERGRNGGVSPELLPPQWAEEARDRVLHEAQLKDVASWAGKGNAAAAGQALPKAPAHAAVGHGNLKAEAAGARDLALLRIDALRARLRGTAAGEDADLAGPAEAEAHLELSRAFCALAQAEAAAGEARRAGEAAGRALQHGRAARRGAPAGREDDAGWHAAAALAVAAAHFGLGEHREAKVAFAEALDLASKALAAHKDEAAEQLAVEVVEGIHRVHEQTDDRKGIEGYIPSLQGLLRSLQLASGDEPPDSVPALTAADCAPPAAGAGSPLPRRAVLLERVALLCVATGRDRDMEVVKTIFTRFRLARESPNLRQLLGMLQSAGYFLRG